MTPLERKKVPRALWIGALGVLLAAGGYYAFHALFVKVSRSVEGPFTGAAAYNRYYVLERYLEERGVSVRGEQRWPAELPAESAIFWFSDDPLPEALRAALGAGGQLWTFHDPDARRDEAGSAPFWRATAWPGEEPEGAYIEDEAEDTRTNDDEDERADPLADTGADAGATLAPPAYPPGEYCAPGVVNAAQFRYGAGCLTLICKKALENEGVIEPGVTRKLDALLRCPQAPKHVLIFAGAVRPWFGTLLAEHAPHALGAALLALALCLVRAGTHFGPRLRARSRERRRLLEHIGAVGRLAGRTDLTPLLSAARRELTHELGRRRPHLGALRGDAYLNAVASATQSDVRDVKRALIDEPGGDRLDVQDIARALQALWRKT